MNDTMLQRLFWKEYRTQRGFWLGVAGTGLVLQLIVLMVSDYAVTCQQARRC